MVIFYYFRVCSGFFHFPVEFRDKIAFENPFQTKVVVKLRARCNERKTVHQLPARNVYRHVTFCGVVEGDGIPLGSVPDPQEGGHVHPSDRHPPEEETGYTPADVEIVSRSVLRLVQGPVRIKVSDFKKIPSE